MNKSSLSIKRTTSFDIILLKNGARMTRKDFYRKAWIECDYPWSQPV